MSMQGNGENWGWGAPHWQQGQWDTMRQWRIERRDCNALSKFDGNVSSFKTWRDRILQHVAESNPLWVHALRPLQKRSEVIDASEVESEYFHGCPAPP